MMPIGRPLYRTVLPENVVCVELENAEGERTGSGAACGGVFIPD
jgi:hypothetical protein